MRPRDPQVALDDAVRAGETIEGFLAGRTLEEYETDRLLSSAVERQFEIVGEALGRALRVDASIGETLPEASEVIGFRDVLAHGYDAVSDRLVWSLAHDRLPGLLVHVRRLLAGRGA